MEAAGAVFLPAAGEREGASTYGVDVLGFYWTSSAYGVDRAFYLDFNADFFYTNRSYRRDGMSVRLVRTVE